MRPTCATPQYSFDILKRFYIYTYPRHRPWATGVKYTIRDPHNFPLQMPAQTPGRSTSCAYHHQQHHQLRFLLPPPLAFALVTPVAQGRWRTGNPVYTSVTLAQAYTAWKKLAASLALSSVLRLQDPHSLMAVGGGGGHGGGGGAAGDSIPSELYHPESI